MYDESKRYDHDQLYEDEALDSEDEFESDDYDYIVDDEDEEENALWDDEEDTDEPPRKKRKKKAVFSDSDTDSDDTELDEYEKTWRSLAKEQRIIDELEADAKENPIEDEDTDDEQPDRKLLKRELREQALKRLEDSARTLRDYENLVAWYDRLDANRQRKERYHELFRSGDDVPLDYGASEDTLCFPDTLNNVVSKLERNVNFVCFTFHKLGSFAGEVHRNSGTLSLVHSKKQSREPNSVVTELLVCAAVLEEFLGPARQFHSKCSHCGGRTNTSNQCVTRRPVSDDFLVRRVVRMLVHKLRKRCRILKGRDCFSVDFELLITGVDDHVLKIHI